LSGREVILATLLSDIDLRKEANEKGLLI
jgi:hypothetical protein